MYGKIKIYFMENIVLEQKVKQFPPQARREVSLNSYLLILIS